MPAKRMYQGTILGLSQRFSSRLYIKNMRKAPNLPILCAGSIVAGQGAGKVGKVAPTYGGKGKGRQDRQGEENQCVGEKIRGRQVPDVAQE